MVLREFDCNSTPVLGDMAGLWTRMENEKGRRNERASESQEKDGGFWVFNRKEEIGLIGIFGSKKRI